MKAAQLVAPGRFEMRDVAVPEPAAGEVLLRVAAAGMCGSDVHIVGVKTALFAMPMMLGHEVIGLAQSGKLKAEVERHPLIEAPGVLAMLEKGRVHGRAVLVP